MKTVRAAEYRVKVSLLLPSRIKPEKKAAEAPGTKLNGPNAPMFPVNEVRRPPIDVAASPTFDPRNIPINGAITLDNAINFPGAPTTGNRDHKDRIA